MDIEAIKPFRCKYDPELSKNKSKGVKSLIVKPRLHERAQDPRQEPNGFGRPAVSKRAVPTGPLPLPDFAKSLVVTVRCFISGLNPLITRARLHDTLRAFGPVVDCQVAVSRLTGASLGIAWAEFAPGAVDAFSRFINACHSGRVCIDASVVTAQPDRGGRVLERAIKQAEARIKEAERAQVAAEQSRRDKQLAPLELRDLTPAQLTEWYEKYLGKSPSYILIRRVNVTPTRKVYDGVSNIFRGTGYRHVVGNYTGIFVVYETEEAAVGALAKNFSRRLFGNLLTLSLTLSGDRIRQGDVNRMAKSGRLSDLLHRSSASSEAHAAVANRAAEGADAAANPAHLEPEPAPRHFDRDVITGELVVPEDVLEAAARQAVADAKRHVKASLFSDRLKAAVVGVVQRETLRMMEQAQAAEAGDATHTSDRSGSASPAAPRMPADPRPSSSSEAGPDAALRGLGRFRGSRSSVPLPFGAINAWELSSRPKRISSAILATKIKKIKTDAKAASPQESQPLAASPEELAQDTKSDDIDVDMKDPDGESPSPMPTPSDNDTLATPTEILEEGPIKPRTIKSKTKKAKSSTKVTPKPSEREPMESDSDDSEDDVGMNIPSLPVSEDLESATHSVDSFRQLVRNQSDFEVLRKALADLRVQPLPENEMKGMFIEANRFPGTVESDVWMPKEGTPPFRLAPARNYSQEERRQYLPNLGTGLPLEIVQKYSQNPLYDVRVKPSVHGGQDRRYIRLVRRASNIYKFNAELFIGNLLSQKTKRTRLARSAIHQWGLYADQTIPAKEFVIEYVGEVLRDGLADVRERNYELEGIDSTYLFKLDDETVVDATKRGNSARFINHSCDPNCVAKCFDYEGIRRVALYSRREIEVDEELTFDYNFVLSKDEAYQVMCACGAANCRGRLM